MNKNTFSAAFTILFFVSFSSAFKDFESLPDIKAADVPLPHYFETHGKGPDRWFGADSRRTYLR